MDLGATAGGGTSNSTTGLQQPKQAAISCDDRYVARGGGGVPTKGGGGSPRGSGELGWNQAGGLGRTPRSRSAVRQRRRFHASAERRDTRRRSRPGPPSAGDTCGSRSGGFRCGRAPGDSRGGDERHRRPRRRGRGPGSSGSSGFPSEGAPIGARDREARRRAGSGARGGRRTAR